MALQTSKRNFTLNHTREHDVFDVFPESKAGIPWRQLICPSLSNIDKEIVLQSGVCDTEIGWCPILLEN
jgi:hypothetical protein